MTNNNHDQRVSHYCCNKLLLEPEKAGLLDLIILLFSSDIKSRRFVDSTEANSQRSFGERWLIFTSVFLQKVLLFFRKPMSRTGYVIEMWLNLLSKYGGLFSLLWNIWKGNFEKPEESSATFVSIIGNLDQRVELDKNIRPGDVKYNASLSMIAAKISYENKAFIEFIVKERWNMEFLGFYNFWNEYLQCKSTHAFMLQDKKDNPNLIVVAFRGTRPFDAYDWCTDVDLSWYELEGVGKIHHGFMSALGLQKDGWPLEMDKDRKREFAYYEIRQKLRDILRKNKNAKFIATGHSLGGALAILFVGLLALHEETLLLERLEGVYTFGQPRVGNKQFGEFMEDKLNKYNVRYSRHVYCNDMVPRLPYDGKILLFKHFGSSIYFDSLYRKKVMQEVPNKNYFSLFWVMPKILNAVWELIRSFIIPFWKGQDYKEGWFQKLYRMMGLIIPGISAHGPQDYDNSTRLDNST